MTKDVQKPQKCWECKKEQVEGLSLCNRCLKRKIERSAFVARMNGIAAASMELNRLFRYPHQTVAGEHIAIIAGERT